MNNTNYEVASARLMEAAAEMRNLGLDQTLKVPMVVFCGDQSSGKSSVLQRLSGVVVPRGVGTCTRSPMEVQMSPASFWSCNISIRRVETFENDDSSTQREPFISGLTLPHHEVMDEFLILAQDAMRFPQFANELRSIAELYKESILVSDKPGKPMKAHLELERIQNQGKNFVQDVIVVDISGPELVYLTVIDLPGIIHSTELEKDVGDVALIDNMVRKYMENENAIVAVTLDMSRDMEQQKMWSLIREFDADHTRTIGVLTKLDLCQNHSLVEDMLKGDKYGLQRGHFALVNPGPKEFNMTRAEVASKEVSFFQSNQINNVPESRIGIANVRDNLSIILTDMMRAHVPRMREEVSIRIANLEREIEECPTVVNPQVEILVKFKSICDFVSIEIDNGVENNGLSNKKNPTMNDSVWAQYRSVMRSFIADIPKSLFPERGSVTLSAEIMHLVDYVLQLMDEDPVKRLATQSSRYATNVLIREAFNGWQSRVDLLLNETEGIAREFMYGAVAHTCKDNRFPELESALNDAVVNLVKHIRKLVNAYIQETCKILLDNSPFTWVNNDLASQVEVELGIGRTYLTGVSLIKTKESMSKFENILGSSHDYTRILNVSKSSIGQDQDDELSPEAEYSSKSIFRSKDKSKNKEKDESVLGSGERWAYAPTREAASALDVIAQVNTYIKLAHSRFVDIIGMSIDHFFFRKMSEELYSTLIRELIECEPPFELVINPEIQAHVDNLHQELENCRKAFEILRKTH